MESQHIQELEIVTSAKLGAKLVFSGVSTMKIPSILVMRYGSFLINETELFSPEVVGLSGTRI